MTHRQSRLILASGSPRRSALLKSMGYEFEIIVPNVDENVQGDARDVVRILALRKAEAVASEQKYGIVIASDTLVSLDEIALGKPQNPEEAKRMLTALSGRTHEVFTGVAILDAADQRSACRVVRTGVRFRELSEAEIDAYIATGEPRDKAGAYAIQGGAGAFVAGWDGSFNNIIGLPTERLHELLTKMMA